MSKLRSDFEKIPIDQYFSFDPRIGEALSVYLPETFTFIEPFAGQGDLINQILYRKSNAECIEAYDINNNKITENYTIKKQDIRETLFNKVPDLFISNPPFSRSYMKLTKEIILRTSNIASSWYLLPFATACNKGFNEQMSRCSKVVPVGRVRWIPHSEHDETKDIAWFKFQREPCITVLEERHISKYTPSRVTELARTWN